jgi:hypothetical protein
LVPFINFVHFEIVLDWRSLHKDHMMNSLRECLLLLILSHQLTLMTSDLLTLSLTLCDDERTRPIIQGRIRMQGARWIPTVIRPFEMFWRQLKYQGAKKCR